MRGLWKAAMLAALLLLVLAPGHTSAYSYGDANTEDVAETFKLVVSSLAQDPPDWQAAADAHKTRRAEIALHFGEAVAASLDNDIQSQKMDATIADYKAVLIMNLKRRFDSAIETMSDYTQAKLLLAKAKATFETLRPYAEAKMSKEQVDAIDADFQKALDDIGNPGLFGVGKKEADPDAMKAAIGRIYDTLEPLFPYGGELQPSPGGETAGTGGEGAGGAGNGQDAGTAPTERTERTNAGVTIGIIAGVVLIGGGAVWWARRKGFF